MEFEDINDVVLNLEVVSTAGDDNYEDYRPYMFKTNLPYEKGFTRGKTIVITRCPVQ